MIHKESWHTEVASFEKERELLYRQYADGQLNAQEFADRMLRFWKKEKKGEGLLEVGESGDLFITPEWMYAHSQELQELQDLKGRARTIRNSIQNEQYLYPRHITEVLLDRRYSIDDVRGALLLIRTEPQVGDSVQALYMRAFSSERNFDSWFSYTLSLSELILKAYEEMSE